MHSIRMPAQPGDISNNSPRCAPGVCLFEVICLLNERNQAIINAIIEKAEKKYPGVLALIGIYGSFQTGDIHEKSDLDLMIVINDDMGWGLGCTFIQDDLNVGHDIYCTTWESLANDAGFSHPNIAKLMDSRIVYCADEKYMERLSALREEARKRIESPVSADDIEAARAQLRDAEHYFSLAMSAELLPEIRGNAGGVIYHAENIAALLNKRYFRFGMKRAYQELKAMPQCPEGFTDIIENVVAADTRTALKESLTELMGVLQEMFFSFRKDVENSMNIEGTYEEMFSNWRNKMYLAAELSDKHMAFMCMTNAQAMLDDIFAENDIGKYDVMAGYDPHDLLKTAQAFDDLLESYRKEYDKAGTKVRRYADIYEFARAYKE